MTKRQRTSSSLMNEAVAEVERLDDPGKQVCDGRQLGDVGVAERAGLLGLDVEDAHHALVPGQRYRQHRGDEPALIDSPDPEEPRIVANVGDPHRLARGGGSVPVLGRNRTADGPTS
jgi:hypothetical protein